MTGKLLMNKITIDLSDEALADLHAIMLKLTTTWKDTPGERAGHVATESDAVRTALAILVDNDWSFADLMPDTEG